MREGKREQNFFSRPSGPTDHQESKAGDVAQLIHPLRRHSRVLFVLMPVLGLALIIWPARALRSDNFVFYLPDASHVLPLQTIGTARYLPLLQVLNTVGRVQGLTVAKDSLKVWFNDSQ